MYDTWPCKKDWFFRDDQIPTPDFTGILEGGYFEIQVGGSILYAVGNRTPPTAGTFNCFLYSDPERTTEILTGDYTGIPYALNYYSGWTWEPLGIDDTADPLANGRWISNDTTIYRNGGKAVGNWIVVDRYDDAGNIVQARHFDGVFSFNPLGIRGLSLTSSPGGTLPAGTYIVHVSGVDSSGREGAASYETITVVANSEITVSWTPHPDAVTYNIYLDCQLKESGVIGAGSPYVIVDETVEDPNKEPPIESDPAIPVDPDDPIITIDPEDGGKAVGVDPDTGTEYEITVRPGVPYNPDEAGTTYTVVTDDGTCINTETFNEADERIAWEKLCCTIDIDGVETCLSCVGTPDASGGGDVTIPLHNLYDNVPSSFGNPEGAATIDDYPGITVKVPAPFEYSYPLKTRATVSYFWEGQPTNPEDLFDSSGELNLIYTIPANPQSTGITGTTQGGYEAFFDITNIPDDISEIRYSHQEDGPESEIPEVSMTVDITLTLTEGWAFDCIGMPVEDVIKPVVQVCRQVVGFTDIYPYYAGPLTGTSNPLYPEGPMLATKTTETQCNPNPLFGAWLDLSHLSALLQSFFGVGSPIPRGNIGAPRPPRGTKEGYNPVYWPYRKWEPGIADGDTLTTAVLLHLHGRKYPSRLRPVVDLLIGNVEFLSLDYI